MDEETMDVKKRSSSHGGSTGSGDGARDDTGCDGQAWRAQVTNPRCPERRSSGQQHLGRQSRQRMGAREEDGTGTGAGTSRQAGGQAGRQWRGSKTTWKPTVPTA